MDAKYVKIRDGARVLSMAYVVATGVTAQGEREVLGCDVGPSEAEAFWTGFLRDLVARGLTGVQRVMSDAPSGLVAALRTVIQGAQGQRCRVHALRNLLRHVPKHQPAMVAAVIRTIFVQPDHAAALPELARVAEALHPRFPRVADDLRDMAADLLAFLHFPPAHWRQIYSTNPLERLHREIGRRADVVGIFPNRAASLRLLGAVLMEQSDEWAAAPRRYVSQDAMAALASPPAAPALPAAAV